jgi:hypothetical protein
MIIHCNSGWLIELSPRGYSISISMALAVVSVVLDAC